MESEEWRAKSEERQIVIVILIENGPRMGTDGEIAAKDRKGRKTFSFSSSSSETGSMCTRGKGSNLAILHWHARFKE